VKRLGPVILLCIFIIGLAVFFEKFYVAKKRMKSHLNSLPRIAIAGLGIESSTFSPALTDEAAFHAQYDTAVYAVFPFLAKDSPMRKKGVWRSSNEGSL
jgi:metallopeptidase family M81